MDGVADSILSMQNIISVLAFVGSALTIVALGLPFLQKDALSSRLKAVAARREELSRKQVERLQKTARIQPKRQVNAMRQVLDYLHVQSSASSKGLKSRLAQAGWRGQSALVTLTFTRLALPLLSMLIALLVVTLSPKMTQPFAVKMMIVLGAGAVGYYLPMFIISNAAGRRQASITQAFPDALDLLSICVEAGLSVEAAFSRVAEEIGGRSPELAEEFGLLTAELAFLGDRRQAFESLADRTGLASTKSLATALIQSEKYGTPMTVSLRVLAQENRDTRMAMAEKKAGALPAQLTVPMIVFFLPVLFIVILGPAIIKVTAKM